MVVSTINKESWKEAAAGSWEALLISKTSQLDQVAVMRQSFPKCMFSGRQWRQTVWWESLGGRRKAWAGLALSLPLPSSSSCPSWCHTGHTCQLTVGSPWMLGYWLLEPETVLHILDAFLMKLCMELKNSLTRNLWAYWNPQCRCRRKQMDSIIIPTSNWLLFTHSHWTRIFQPWT